MPAYSPYFKQTFQTFVVSPLLPLVISGNQLILSDVDFSVLVNQASNNEVMYNNMAINTIRQSYTIINKSETEEFDTCLIDTDNGTFRVINSYLSVIDSLFVEV